MPQGTRCTAGTQAVVKLQGRCPSERPHPFVWDCLRKAIMEYLIHHPLFPGLSVLLYPPSIPSCTRGALQEWAELCFPLQSVLMLLLG